MNKINDKKEFINAVSEIFDRNLLPYIRPLIKPWHRELVRALAEQFYKEWKGGYEVMSKWHENNYLLMQMGLVEYKWECPLLEQHWKKVHKKYHDEIGNDTKSMYLIDREGIYGIFAQGVPKVHGCCIQALSRCTKEAYESKEDSELRDLPF